ncbi:16.9 kDa class I heat shock protein 3 [Cajanus cajan]|uniref:18.2 kDa class I heat shock protein n=1 Tax=Cajanus cajan TaxID=3821 RepID=A0A151SX67_CAJCA|nr:16.9 kDa class I heat shock protein 3 [Cajanus cajan]KYP59373.1 18.2 kDa class I heat shock protein [Cajanus cajan]
MDWLIGSYRGRNPNPWCSSPFTGLWDPRDAGADNDDITSALAHAHVDWRETPTAHIFRADLPGVRKEDLKVQVEEDKILQISGERVKEKEDRNDKWHRVERQCGTFLRRFRLPEDANADQIGCTLENGVLTITVPKLETVPENKNVRQIDVA